MNKLEAYKQLVTRYHLALDLVSDLALEDFDQKITDSMAYVEELGHRLAPHSLVLDVGSGAGLPGIVLGIGLPQHSIVLVERRQKRAAFLNIVASQLKLHNVQVFNLDVSELKAITADAITAMAVGSLKLLYCLTNHLHNHAVLLVSKKGDEFGDEVTELEQALQIKADFVEVKPLKKIPSPPTRLVSRETIYGNLISVGLLGGRECTKM
jgi:16S rRNA (guanine527-N7)-methyltransferase